MTRKDRQKLEQLGFHRGDKGDHMTKKFVRGGLVKVVLIVKGSEPNYEHYFLVGDPVQDKEKQQWLPVSAFVPTIRALIEAIRGSRAARRALEKRPARRFLRQLST